jgi:hypothetical protein
MYRNKYWTAAALAALVALPTATLAEECWRECDEGRIGFEQDRDRDGYGEWTRGEPERWEREEPGEWAGEGYPEDEDDRFGGEDEDDRFGGEDEDDRFGGEDEDDRFGGEDEDDRFGGEDEDDRFGGEDEDDRFGGEGEDDRFGGEGEGDLGHLLERAQEQLARVEAYWGAGGELDGEFPGEAAENKDRARMALLEALEAVEQLGERMGVIEHIEEGEGDYDGGPEYGHEDEGEDEGEGEPEGDQEPSWMEDDERR